MKDNKEIKAENDFRIEKLSQIIRSLKIDGKEKILARIVFKIAWSASRKYHLSRP